MPRLRFTWEQFGYDRAAEKALDYLARGKTISEYERQKKAEAARLQRRYQRALAHKSRLHRSKGGPRRVL